VWTPSFFYIKPSRIITLEFFFELSKRKCFCSFLILFNDWHVFLSHLPQMESLLNTWWSESNMKILITNCSLRVEKSYFQHCFNQFYTIYFFLIKPTDALISQIYFSKKLYMFRAVPLPTIRSFPLYIRHWYISCRFDDIYQCRMYNGNSWWWAEQLPETGRFSWQNKFGKLVCLLVLLKRNLLRCTVAWT
jgi:hypothetical protein